jgi:hypothetical protein
MKRRHELDKRKIRKGARRIAKKKNPPLQRSTHVLEGQGQIMGSPEICRGLVLVT